MKRFSVFFIILVCLLTLGFVSCDDWDTGDGIVGKWEGMYSVYPVTLKLFENSSFTYTVGDTYAPIYNAKGTYRLVDGDILELIFDSKPDEPERGYYDGNTIRLPGVGTLTRK